MGGTVGGDCFAFFAELAATVKILYFCSDVVEQCGEEGSITAVKIGKEAFIARLVRMKKIQKEVQDL